MKQPFHCPDVPVLLFVSRSDLRFRAVQHRFHMCHRVVPTKAERWQQLIDGICLRSRKKKGNDAGRKNSAYCSTVPIKSAGRLPVLCLRVRRTHFFDRHPSDTREAGKLRARVNSVKSGVAHGDANRIDRFAAAIPLLSRTSSRRNQQRDSFFVFSRTRSLLFLVKKIFGRDENKISNKVHFFLVDFESDF